jgi:oligosaccharide repeat unit polymerase
LHFPGSGRLSHHTAKFDINLRGLTHIHVAMCILLFLYVAFQTYFIAQQFGGNLLDVYFAGGEQGRAYRNSFLLTQELAAESSFSGGAIVKGLISYVLFFGSVSIFSGACLWVIGKRVLATTPLLLSAAFSILSLQRTTFLVALTLFLFAVLAARRVLSIPKRDPADLSSTKARKWRTPATLLLAISIAILLYPQSIRVRGTSDASGVQSLLPYLLSGVGGLNYRDESPLQNAISFDVDPAAVEATPGSNTFNSIFIILQRFDVPVHTAPSFLDYAHVHVLGTDLATNVGTLFFNFWLDFGLFGVFFITFGIALLGTLAQRLAWQGRVAAMPAFAFAMTTIFWSFFGNFTLGNDRYILITVASMFIIPRFVRPSVKVPDQQPSTEESVPLSRAV